MPKSMTRARRRHLRFTAIRRARRAYPETDRPEKVADNMKACSCFMCCNRRQLDGPTLQERQALMATPSPVEVDDDLLEARLAGYDITGEEIAAAVRR